MTNHPNKLSKVPQITAYFWVIKVLCTTVGETVSDFLNAGLGLGLQFTSVVIGLMLVVALVAQFRSRQYTPGIYWLAVVLLSVFGTLVTDLLTDSLGVPLESSTLAFTIALSLVFISWFRVEKSLSIHSITTVRRETFYWLAIFFTFALGTASGDLMAEGLGLGYFVSGLVTLGVITSVAVAWKLRLNSVLSFWIAYILTRPLGASFGDYLSQPRGSGGLGFGVVITSAIFLILIVIVVLYLSVSRRDLLISSDQGGPVEAPYARIQTAAVLALLAVGITTGYQWQSGKAKAQAKLESTASAPLGALTEFDRIAADTLALAKRGDLRTAKERAKDLEHAWDVSAAKLKRMNQEAWKLADDAIDRVLACVRSSQPRAVECIQDLESLMKTFEKLDPPRRPAESR